MEIESAIQHYLTDLRETAPRARVEFDLSVLARLQEYLQADVALESVEAVQAEDLRAFIRDWYRAGEDVSPPVARQLVGAVLGWAAWLDDRFANVLRPPIAPTLSPLEESLPRAAQASDLLRRYARREDLSESIPVAETAGGSPLGTISAGVSRVIRPTEIDYDRAEEDIFEVLSVGERAVTLHSPARAQLGVGPASPVSVPARAARIVCAGDFLHAEIAPTAAGWEIINLEIVYPGGLNDRP